MGNCPVPCNWRQNTMRNCRFSWIWRLLLQGYNLSKRLCATVLLLEICVKTRCATGDLLEVVVFCQQAKTCPKHRARLLCCLKLASIHSPQLSFFLKLASFVKKLKLVQKTVRSCPVAWDWRLLLKSQTLCKTRCATVLLLEIGVKTHCATVVLLQIGDFCSKVETCPKDCAQLSCCWQLASKHSAQLSNCLNLASFDNKLKLVQNTVRNCPFAWNWRQNTMRNCRFSWILRILLKG